MRTKGYNATVYRRKRRVRARIARGIAECPRISVFRSNTHIHVQFIDDSTHATLVAASSLDSLPKNKRANLAACKEVGLLAAKRAKEKGISKGVFDRGAHKYHGRLEALVSGLREGGIVV